ncbi:hypothetical protein FOA52_002322 [Chlamydomonas sp. UWO 241]|nr:hypothetical protein FOA52_002322 [Chlamydomonas sp. UWO 241]
MVCNNMRKHSKAAGALVARAATATESPVGSGSSDSDSRPRHRACFDKAQTTLLALPGASGASTDAEASSQHLHGTARNHISASADTTDAFRALSAVVNDLKRQVGRLEKELVSARTQPQIAPPMAMVGAPQIADDVAALRAMVESQKQQIEALTGMLQTSVTSVSHLVSRVPGAPMQTQMPHARAPAKAAQPARPAAAAAAPVASAAGAPAGARPAAAGAARAAPASSRAMRGLPAVAAAAQRRHSFVATFSMEDATAFAACHDHEDRHVIQYLSCIDDEETVEVAAVAARQVAAAAAIGVSLPVCLAEPVFFIRDGKKFPDMVHALKPNPKNHIQEAWRIMDFFSHHPESLHMFTFLLDDVGIPKDYRHMPGFGVHTFRLYNKAGRESFVKFHWIPKEGIECLLDDEAVIVGGTNHSHATKDLYDSVAAGNYPEWTLMIQVMNPADADKFDFDPLDVTKTWPEDLFPLQPVGRMVLNRNPDNFFNENEQVAFAPAVIVPGIGYTDDKMLQTRLFSYPDTQRHRLGPNYLMLPVNAPKCAYHNNHHDGSMNFAHRDEEVNYFPSRFDPVRHAEPMPTHSAEVINGKREMTMIEKENNFAQAGARWRSFDPARRDRFVVRVVEFLSDPRLTGEIRRIWVGYWSQCDQMLGQKVAAKLQGMGAL